METRHRPCQARGDQTNDRAKISFDGHFAQYGRVLRWLRLCQQYRFIFDGHFCSGSYQANCQLTHHWLKQLSWYFRLLYWHGQLMKRYTFFRLQSALVWSRLYVVLPRWRGWLNKGVLNN